MGRLDGPLCAADTTSVEVGAEKQMHSPGREGEVPLKKRNRNVTLLSLFYYILGPRIWINSLSANLRTANSGLR